MEMTSPFGRWVVHHPSVPGGRHVVDRVGLSFFSSLHATKRDLADSVLAGTDQAARLSVRDRPRLRIIHFSGPAFHESIEKHVVDSAPIRAYNAAKTVADVFRSPHKIGLDVAIDGSPSAAGLHPTRDGMAPGARPLLHQGREEVAKAPDATRGW